MFLKTVAASISRGQLAVPKCRWLITNHHSIPTRRLIFKYQYTLQKDADGYSYVYYSYIFASFLQALKDIPRNAYYIATKVGRYETDPKKMFDFSRQKTLESVDQSLKLLGLHYVDIIQVVLYSYATKFAKTFIKFCAPLVFTQHKTPKYTQFSKWLRDIKMFRKLPGMNSTVHHTQNIISIRYTSSPISLRSIFMLYYYLLFTLPCGFLTGEFPEEILYATFVFPSLSLPWLKRFTFPSCHLKDPLMELESNNFKIQTEQTGGDKE